MRNVYAAVIGLVAFGAACGSDDGPSGTQQPTGNTVQATTALTFSPATITIDVGESVTWAFGSLDHNVSFAEVAGAPASIGNTRNANVSRTFTTAGTFPYDCTLHPGMSGTVVAQ